MSSLNIIPQTVYVDHILEHLDFKDVGCLIMTNQYLKEIFDDNNLWNLLYLRTNPLKILDTSVHIGYHDPSERNLSKEILLKKYHVTNPKYWHDYTFTSKCPNSNDINLSNCCNLSFKSYVPSFEEIFPNIRGGTIITPEQDPNNTLPGFFHSRYVFDRPAELKEQYYNIIKKIHIKYNKINKLNLCNLCSNPNHYIRETLGYSEGIQKSDSFKKLTLSKMRTIRKRKLASLKRKLDRNREKLLKMKKQLEEQENIVKEQSQCYERENNFCCNVENMK